MRKIALTVAAVFALGTTNAQEIKTDAGTFTKPKAGTYIMEANLTPDITGGGIFSLPSLNSDLGLVGIKVRKFSSETRALRMGANLTIKDSGVDKVDTEFSIGVSLGAERHFKGAERLSTYWGYEANIGYVKSNGKAGEDPLTGDPIPAQPESKIGFGANLFSGFDYYIMPKIYLGAEVSYGLAVTNTQPEVGDGTTKLELAPSITPTFRIGWQF